MNIKNLVLRAFAFSCLISFALVTLGQDTAWQKVSLSKDVFISMPAPIHSLDTLQLKVTNSTSNGCWFQTKMVKQSLTVKNGDELVQAYESFVHGYLTSKGVSIYTNVVSDTAFGATEGKWIHSTYAQNGNFSELFTYAVLVNSHFYIITFYVDHPMKTNDHLLLSKYIGSLSFSQTPIREYSDDFRLQAHSYRFGERLGRYFPYIVFLGIAGLVIYFVVKKLSPPKNRT